MTPLLRAPQRGLLHWGSACLALICLALQWPVHLQALTIDGDRQYQFAESLFKSNQYRRAAEEYQRFSFFFPGDARRRQALFKAGQAFLLAKDPSAAWDRFNELTVGDELDTIAVESHFMMVECDLQMNQITRAALELNNLILLSDDEEIRNRAYYRLGWLQIDLTDWSAARKAFARISNSRRDHFRIDELEQELDRAGHLPSRSPTLAGTLSIIPGAGQLYCNRYEDALIAFAVNLGILWAAHDAFDQDQYALGGVLAFIGMGFYAGNIYGAVGDAHKFNQNRQRQFGESLQRHLVTGSLSGDPWSPSGVLFSLHVPF
jgi:tetratricopeptide (TPR) repeat protein